MILCKLGRRVNRRVLRMALLRREVRVESSHGNEVAPFSELGVGQRLLIKDLLIRE